MRFYKNVGFSEWHFLYFSQAWLTVVQPWQWFNDVKALMWLVIRKNIPLSLLSSASSCSHVPPSSNGRIRSSFHHLLFLNHPFHSDVCKEYQSLLPLLHNFKWNIYSGKWNKSNMLHTLELTMSNTSKLTAQFKVWMFVSTPMKCQDLKFLPLWFPSHAPQHAYVNQGTTHVCPSIMRVILLSSKTIWHFSVTLM